MIRWLDSCAASMSRLARCTLSTPPFPASLSLLRLRSRAPDQQPKKLLHSVFEVIVPTVPMPQPFASPYRPQSLRPLHANTARGYIGTQMPPTMMPSTVSSRTISPRTSRKPFGQGGGTWGQMSAASRFGPGATAQSFAPSNSSLSSPKPYMQKHIDGELGSSPPMVGVTTMSFSRNQQLYIDDFKEARRPDSACHRPAQPSSHQPLPLPSQVNANKIMHPYLTMVGDSSPHNLITGTCPAAQMPCTTPLLSSTLAEMPSLSATQTTGCPLPSRPCAAHSPQWGAPLCQVPPLHRWSAVTTRFGRASRRAVSSRRIT